MRRGRTIAVVVSAAKRALATAPPAAAAAAVTFRVMEKSKKRTRACGHYISVASHPIMRGEDIYCSDLIRNTVFPVWVSSRTQQE